MNKLIWVYDSPFSRSIKWLLIKQSVDYLLDYLLPEHNQFECNYGAVLLLSTLFAAIYLAEEQLIDYRSFELVKFLTVVEHDATYRQILTKYQGQPSNSLPFEYENFNKAIES